jgi:hypothetical protein
MQWSRAFEQKPGGNEQREKHAEPRAQKPRHNKLDSRRLAEPGNKQLRMQQQRRGGYDEDDAGLGNGHGRERHTKSGLVNIREKIRSGGHSAAYTMEMRMREGR